MRFGTAHVSSQEEKATYRIRPSSRDLALAGALLALNWWLANRYVDFEIPPFEDAAMLMRYAGHVAQGHGIVWNIGEAPLDGATDLLFMLLTAALSAAGWTVEFAVRVLAVGSHLLTVLLIYFGMRSVQGATATPAFLSASFFSLGPGLFLAAAYFGTPFFVLLVVLTWLQAHRLRTQEGDCSNKQLGAFALLSLTVGIARPEGVLICVFMTAGLLLVLPRNTIKRLVLWFVGVFFLLGGVYFIWRWWYFAAPLPNPYLKKGGGALHLESLRISARYSLRMIYPFLPAFLLALRSRPMARLGASFLIPVGGSIAMWILLSQEMNFGSRFQYPTLALCVLAWYPLVKTLRRDLGLPALVLFPAVPKAAILALGAVVVGLVFLRQLSHSRTGTYGPDGRYEAGVLLGRWANCGYSVATTEAGLIPLYSRWRAIDTWGLNDRWIARQGLITEAYLREQRPDVVMWHGDFSPLQAVAPNRSGASAEWGRMVDTLHRYVTAENFTLAAVFGIIPNDVHCFYVRPDIPNHDSIVHALGTLRYPWGPRGEFATNLAELDVSSARPNLRLGPDCEFERPPTIRHRRSNH